MAIEEDKNVNLSSREKMGGILESCVLRVREIERRSQSGEKQIHVCAVCVPDVVGDQPDINHCNNVVGSLSQIFFFMSQHLQSCAWKTKGIAAL